VLIAREKERKMLQDAYESMESCFAAVYGRRRVGKTYLIRETLSGKFTFQHTGYYKGKMNDQLFEFASSLKEYGLKDFERPKSWLEAFELLKDLLRQSGDGKKVVFLDELSWMDTRGSNFLMALEGFWNGWASARKDILLIVCGSVTSWMLDNVVHNKGGLYNRLTFKIHLKPFTLGECEEYLQSREIVMNRHQILQGYMIMGGIPYYWGFLEKGKSLPQNIDAMFFAPDAKLEGEFTYLYASLFEKPEVYVRIVTALGQKKPGMTREELLETTGETNNGQFSKKLEELEACGFIRVYANYGKKERNRVYQLIDNYTLFYFKFLERKPNDPNFWTNRTDSAAISAWCGLAFERVCLQHVEQMKKALGISGVLTESCAWSCKADPEEGIRGTQIDLLIVRRDQVINLCEMKYADKMFTITKKVDEDLREKVSDFRTVTGTRYAVHPTIVTTYGLKENAYSGNVQFVITAEDLFA